MALDGAFLACLRQELLAGLLDNGQDARIDKIHQPSREELVLSMRLRRGGAHKLYISARANSPRIHLIPESMENPPSPPMFCMLLRKRLTGGRLTAIRQSGWERQLLLDFDCVNELGDIVSLTLSVEIMGRHSNIILIGGDGKIIDSIKRVDYEMSSVRPVLPGLEYAPPPMPAGKLDLSRCTPDDLTEGAVNRGGPLSEALLAVSHGLSPLMCREAAFLAARGTDPDAAGMSGELKSRLSFYLGRIKAAVTEGAGRVPFIMQKPDGSPLDYGFMRITQYGLDAVGSEAAGFSSLLDAFYSRRDAADRARQRSQDILRVLTRSSERITRKLVHQRRELEQSGNRDKLRVWADLIIAGAHEIPKGAASAELTDYYDPECRRVTVKLDPAISAAANAQKYYKEYRKAQTAEQVLARQIELGETELEYIDSVFDALSRAGTAREMDELRSELTESGYLRLRQGKQKAPPPTKPLEFVSEDGFKILVGRNNIQNDRLTLRTAKGNDIWMHTKDIPGSHVIVVTGGAQPPDSTLTQAASLAALHSKAAGSRQVPVDYTQVRYVKKPSGAKPGMVIYDNHRTAYAQPDPELARRLSAREDTHG